MPAVYSFDHATASVYDHVVITDKDGTLFRIKFDSRDGGIVINKVSDTDSAITIFPHVSNEVRVK